MTDRHHAYLVILDDGIREDDAEYIRNLLAGIKRVIDVKPADVGTMEIEIAKSRLRHEFFQNCLEFFK